MKASKNATRQMPLVPYHRLLSLRGQIDEIDAALRRLEHPLSAGRRCTLPPLALIALRKAVEVELWGILKPVVHTLRSPESALAGPIAAAKALRQLEHPSQIDDGLLRTGATPSL